MKGKVTLQLGDYNELIIIKKKYFELMELVADAVERNRLSMEKYAVNNKDGAWCFLPAIVDVESICKITEWQHSEIDKINIESCRKKAKSNQKPDGHQE